MMPRILFGWFLLVISVECHSQSDPKVSEVLQKAWQAHVSVPSLRSVSFVLGGESTRYESKTDNEGFFRSIGVTDPDSLAKYVAPSRRDDSRDSSFLASMRRTKSRYSFDFENQRWASFHTSSGAASYSSDSLKTVLSQGTYNGRKQPQTTQEAFNMAQFFPPLLISLLRQTDSVAYRGIYQLDGTAYVCLGLPVGRKAWALYFDPNTFLLRRIAVTSTNEDPLWGQEKTVFSATNFTDYHQLDGLTIPRSYTQIHSSDPFSTSQTTYFYSEVAINQPLDEFYFRPPYRRVPRLVVTDTALHRNLKLIVVKKFGVHRWLVAADRQQAVWFGAVAPAYDSVARRYLAGLRSLPQRTIIDLDWYPDPSALAPFLDANFKIARLPKPAYSSDIDLWQFTANGAALKKKNDELSFQLDSLQTWRLDGLTVQALRYGKTSETVLLYIPELQTAFVNHWTSTNPKKSELEYALKEVLQRRGIQPTTLRLMAMTTAEDRPDTIAFGAWLASFGEKR